MLRNEFLELLQTDLVFREEVRRQLLTEDLLALPERFDRLTELIGETVEAVRDLTIAQQRTEEALQRHGQQIEALIQAQQRTEETFRQYGEQIQALFLTLHRTEEALQQLINWQRGEVGRRDGERYERDMIRSAPALLSGGRGGAADHPSVQLRLTEQLRPLLTGEEWAPEKNPFLADLIWWKGEQVAIIEISTQVNGYDVLRASERAETLRQAGAQAVAIVIGDEWANLDSRLRAKARQVEWKVGSDLSEGFLKFRRAPPD
jgi:hypothetical protein